MATAAVEVSESVQQAIDSFFEFLPRFLGFLIILIVGYFIAKLVKAAVDKGLEALGMDRALHDSDAGRYVEKVSPGSKPSRLIGTIVFWIVFVFVLSGAISALGIPAVEQFMNDVLAYLPNVIAAVVIFVLAAVIAGAAVELVERTVGDSPTGKLLRAALPALVMVIAVFMILNQLRIAPEIVTITYAAILGAVALGMALAFGLGGRDVARRMLEEAYERGRSSGPGGSPAGTGATPTRATPGPGAPPPPPATGGTH